MCDGKSLCIRHFLNKVVEKAFRSFGILNMFVGVFWGEIRVIHGFSESIL